MESNYNVTTQMRNKFAMHMFHVTLPMDFVDKINSYVDNTLIPLDDNYGKVKGNAELQHSYAKGLVGQIRQNERSAQLDCDVQSASQVYQTQMIRVETFGLTIIVVMLMDLHILSGLREIKIC